MEKIKGELLDQRLGKEDVDNIKIDISDLTVKYGEFTAINNINLNISKGMFGLLGRNGAGKTTLMKTLVTLKKKSNGVINILNRSIDDVDFIRSNIGYLPQDFNMYPNMSVKDIIDYLASLSNLKNPIRNIRIEEVLKTVNLENHKNKKFKNLSGGMKRRLGIACAIVHDPKIIIVDEPTAGLDPEERIRIRNLLSGISQNKIVILSTHIVEDIEHSCEKIGVLKDGEIIYKGNINDLKQNISGFVFEKNISINEYEAYNGKYIIVSRKEIGNNMVKIRFINIGKKEYGFISVEPNFEDAYIGLLNGMIYD